MAYYKHLVGKKVYLSPIDKENDIPKYTKWLNDLDVSARLGGAAVLYTEEYEREFLENGQKGAMHYAIIRASDDTLLGNASLFEFNHIHRKAQIGLFIGDRENRGKGYGREAMGLLLAYAYGVMNIHNVMLQAFSFNENAIGLYESLGFREIGRRRESYFFKGVYYDEVFMELLDTDFKPHHYSVLTPVTFAIEEDKK